MKRFVSFLTAVSLLIGLLGMVSVTAFAETVITTVELSYTEPAVGGNVADSMLVAPEDAGYTVSTNWYDQTAFQSVDSGTFQEGHRYLLTLGVYPKDGYSMDESAIILINGQEDMELYYYLELFSGSLEGNREYVLISNPVTIELAMPEPEVGEPISDTVLTAPDGAEYEVWSGWYDADANVWEDEPLTEGSFEDGEKYILWGEIVAPGIQSLNDVVDVTVNGEQVNWYFSDDLYNSIWFTKNYTVIEPTQISQVEITGVTAPVVGQLPTTEGIVCDAEGVTLTPYWYYYDYEHNCYTSADGAFEEGKVYQLQLRLEAQDGYEYAYGAEQNITVDGEKPSFATWYWSTLIDAEMIYPLGDVEMVDMVMIEAVPEFAVGQTVSLEQLMAGVALPEDAGYEITEVEFMDEYFEDVTDSLEKGIYLLRVVLAPKEGYWFDAANMDFATPGGYPTAMEDVQTDQVSLLLEIDLRDTVSQVEITILEFALGDAITTEGVSITGGNITEAGWYDGNWNEAEGVFEEQKYILDLYFAPKEGFVYTEDTVILVNGEEFLGNKYFYENDFNIEYELDFRVPGIPIDRVELPAFPANVQPGQTVEPVQLQVPAGAAYQAFAVWVDMESYESVSQLGQKGIYACNYVIIPNDGYEISEDAVITVGGQEHMGIKEWEDRTVVIMQVYPLGYPTVDSLEVSVAEPVIGAEAELLTLQLEGAEVHVYWIANEDGGVNDEALQVTTFEEGMYHFLAMEVYAQEGYALAKDLKVKVNGKTVEAYYAGMGSFGIVAVPYGKLIDPANAEPGDFNLDGQISDADAMYLLRHTLFPSRYPITHSGDVNCDGTVSDADAMYLLRYTLFPERFPLYPEK